MAEAERKFSAVSGGADEVPDHEPDHGVVVPARADGSPLEALRQQIEKEAQRAPIVLGTEERPGFAVRYTTDISMERLTAWQKASKDSTFEGGIDPIRLASICLANCCDAILHKDAVVTSEDGPVKFASRALLDMIGAGDALEAVQHWYGSDGIILVTFGKVMEAAGYDEDAVTRDPTRPL